jgi:hypothetical protein
MTRPTVASARSRRLGAGVKKPAQQLALDYHRTIRAPSQEERHAAACAARREARTAAREAYLAQPLPALPTPAELGYRAEPLRPESVAAARAARLPARSLHVVLADLVNCGSFHGSWLPLRIDCGDGPRTSEKAILLSERVGWIRRGKYDPRASREFMVFGIGGISGKHLVNLDEEHRSPVLHHWITVTTKWLDPEYVREMLLGGGVL